MENWTANFDVTEWRRIAKILCENSGKWVIYAIINKVNGKIYIGKTYEKKESFKAYTKPSNLKSCTYLWNAFKKYGIGNFNLKIIEDFENYDNDRLLYREKFWIAYYGSLGKNGYNAVADSLEGLGYIRTEETKRKHSKALRGNIRLHKRKPIKQLDKNTGELIKIWSGVDEAAVGITGKKKAGGNIIGALKGRNDCHGRPIKNAYGFRWEYVDNSLENLEIKTGKPMSNETKIKLSAATKGKKVPSKQKKIKQIDIKTGEVINIWDYSVDAAIALTGNINSCVTIKKSAKSLRKNGKKRIGLGFYWEYVNEPLVAKPNNRRRPFYGWKKIKQINLETGKILGIWENSREAAKSIGDERKYKRITEICTGSAKTNKAYGFGWEYLDD